MRSTDDADGYRTVGPLTTPTWDRPGKIQIRRSRRPRIYYGGLGLAPVSRRYFLIVRVYSKLVKWLTYQVYGFRQNLSTPLAG